ncbi:serine--tRNA ligase [Paenibacillus sp. GD4]|uniref:serine--tRNA ligase n=1 Tax=Paenibacillus sp. GD4 TaxID=3068890 RepID=UPI0027968FD1|nr:serine--tRNA ligase [Paenibacillus sp. GD4]MDQ1913491.1 serine--tRNA ligase [Paenibacillus sp. GD4]
MLEIKWIREHAEEVQTAADRKGISVSIKELLDCEVRRRKLQQEVDQVRQQRNENTNNISNLIKLGNAELSNHLKRRVKELNLRLRELEQELAAAENRLNELALLVPNIVSHDTPVGTSDEDNVEVRRVGEPTLFPFNPRDHVALGELHHMIDVPRGVKTSGTRHYYLRGVGAQLHRAVQQLALDLLLVKGFTLLEVPLLVREEALTRAGFFPLGADQVYRLEGHDAWLVGTSEVPLVSYYAKEVVDVSAPIKLAAVSTCFRSEVGSAGRDVHGLYRVHQFAKVEQVILCEASLQASEELLQEITANAEELLQLLELPYRVMAVCTGDMSQKTYKQFDIETWMPSRNAYGETHSSSSLLDFQARRSHIRYRDEQGKLRYCYTLNNTAVASPRILIPLLENHQLEDGSIRIPAALRPYMNGLELITPLG